MRQIFIFILIGLMIFACAKSPEKEEVNNHSVIKQVEKPIIKIVKEKIQYSYEPAEFKDDGVSYWWVLFKTDRHKVNWVIRQNHSFFSPTEAKDSMTKEGNYEYAFLLNFKQISEATYIFEGEKDK